MLQTAFAEGLLSERTLAHRLELLFGPRLVDPQRLVGDLALRGRRSYVWFRRLVAATVALRGRAPRSALPPLLLALDSTVEHEELLVGRSSTCDIRLSDRTVSRRHARLVFRDGAWVIHDLESTNGTLVNGVPVGRCQLYPGDRLLLGEQAIDLD